MGMNYQGLTLRIPHIRAGTKRCMVLPARRHPRTRTIKRGPSVPRVSHSVTIAAAAASPPRQVESKEERITDTKVRVTLTVPSDMCQKHYRKVLKEWNSKVAITGFRKGHAPEAVLVEQLGGRQAVYNTCASELIENVVGPALERSPSAASAIADSESVDQLDETAFDPQKDFTFSITFDTLPPIKWKTDYRDIEVTIEATSDDARDQQTAEKRFRMLLKEGGTLRVVSGRGLQPGDVAIVDFDASLVSTGEEIAGASRRAMQLDTETADEAFLPGVAAAMVGMTAGETRETTLTLPVGEDQPEALRGAEAAVKIKVTEVFEWELPEADDAWAATVMGPGSTVKDVRQRLLENAQTESDEQTRQRVADALTEAIGAAVDAQIPDIMLQEAGQHEYSRKLNEALQKGVLQYEQAQQLAAPQMVASFIKSRKAELEALQRSSLGFADILSREGIVVPEADIQAEMAAAIEQVRSVNPDGPVNEEGLMEQVVRGLETQAAMDWLVANCQVEIVPPGFAGKATAEAKKAEKSPKTKAKSGTGRPRGRPKGSGKTKTVE